MIWTTLGLACGVPKETASGTSAMPYCDETSTPIGWDEAAPGGAIPSDVLLGVEGTHTAPFSWEAGGSAVLELTVARGGEPSWVTSVAVYPDTDGPSPSIGIVCEDHLALPVRLDFVTDDLSFVEAWDLTFTWPDPVGAEGVDFWVSVDPADLGGSWAPDVSSVPDLATYDTVSVAFEGRFVSAGPFGTVAVLGEKASAGTASQESVLIATWALE